MRPDRVLKHCTLPTNARPMDIAFHQGLILAIAPAIDADCPTEDLRGGILAPGFVDCHVHLDKAHIMGQCAICAGTLPEAVRLTAAAKAAFTPDDIYHRAEQVLTRAIVQGTQVMRSFVEVDPRVGLKGVQALTALRADYAHAIDLQLCAFAQEGLTQEMETYALLDQALRAGADLVGGCPYTDPDPARHVRLIFDLAERHGVDVDFHVDFDLNPAQSNLDTILRETRARGYGGRVNIGHVTQFSALPPADFALRAAQLRDAGVALTVLPATDLYLNGRDHEMMVPRGVTPAHRLNGVRVALATNNVMNPFTPFGDASLPRMANLYANVVQAAQDTEILRVFDMITLDAGLIMGQDRSIRVGGPADLVWIAAPDPVSAIREIAEVRRGWKAGRPSFDRPAAQIL